MLEHGMPVTEDEEELPCSLKPANPTSQADTLVEEQSSVMRPRARGLLLRSLLLGLILGSALGIFAYLNGTFQRVGAVPWNAVKIDAPLLLTPFKDVEAWNYPRRWQLTPDGVFLGLDANSQSPRLFDPAASQAFSTSDTLAAGAHGRNASNVTLAGAPPLDPTLKLAWIESSGDQRSQLVLQPFNLPGLPGNPVANRTTSAEIPGASFPFSPLAIDHPASQANLLITAGLPAQVSCWRVDPNSQALAKQWGPVELDLGILLAPPRGIVRAAQSTSVTITLLLVGDKGVQLLDSATGQKLDAMLAWQTPFTSAPLAIAENPNLGLWLVSDGKQLEVFSLRDHASPDRAYSQSLPADFSDASAPPRLLAAPRTGLLAKPDFIIVSPHGTGLWISRQFGSTGRTFSLPDSAAPAAPMAAIDLNEDSFPDLIGLNLQDGFWVIDGQTLKTQQFNSTAAGAVPARNYVVADAPAVLWDLPVPRTTPGERLKLRSIFTDAQGRFHSLQLPVSSKLTAERAPAYLAVSNAAHAVSTK